MQPSSQSQPNLIDKQERQAHAEAFRYLPPWVGGLGFVGMCCHGRHFFSIFDLTFPPTEAKEPEKHIEMLKMNAHDYFELGDLQLEPDAAEQHVKPASSDSAHDGRFAPPASLSLHTPGVATGQPAPTTLQPTLTTFPIPTGAYVQPYPLQLSPGAALPSSWQQHALLQRTAHQVAANPALEVMLLVKQGSHAKLAFLQREHPLHAYYGALKARAAQGLPAVEAPPLFPCNPNPPTPPKASVVPAQGGLVDYDSDSSDESGGTGGGSSAEQCADCASVAPLDPLAHAFAGLPSSIWSPDAPANCAMQRLLQRWTAHTATKPPAALREAASCIVHSAARAGLLAWRRRLWGHRTAELAAGEAPYPAWFVTGGAQLPPPHRLLAPKGGCQLAVRGALAAALAGEAVATAAAPQAAVIQLHGTGGEHSSAFASLRGGVLLAVAAASLQASGRASSHCDVLPPATDNAEPLLYGCAVQNGLLHVRLHVPQVEGGCLGTPLHVAVAVPSCTQVQATLATLGNTPCQEHIEASMLPLVHVHASADAGSGSLQLAGRLGAGKRRRFAHAAAAETGGEEGGAVVSEATVNAAAVNRLERAKLLRGRFQQLTCTAGSGGGAQ